MINNDIDKLQNKHCEHCSSNNQIAVVESESRNSCVTFCQIWYGYPQEKVIVEFEGIHSEDEDRYADVFTEYNYDIETGENGTKHVHKYNPELVQQLVDHALKSRNSGGSCEQ